jgi:uncharacterized protein involved in response to NO
MNIAISADRPANRCALFDYGFRPFFLLSGCYALAIIPIWLYRFAHAATPFGALPRCIGTRTKCCTASSSLLAGFLLTAVPSWTVRVEPGRPLIIVVSLWCGRLP